MNAGDPHGAPPAPSCASYAPMHRPRDWSPLSSGAVRLECGDGLFLSWSKAHPRLTPMEHAECADGGTESWARFLITSPCAPHLEGSIHRAGVVEAEHHRLLKVVRHRALPAALGNPKPVASFCAAYRPSSRVCRLGLNSTAQSPSALELGPCAPSAIATAAVSHTHTRRAGRLHTRRIG